MLRNYPSWSARRGRRHRIGAGGGTPTPTPSTPNAVSYLFFDDFENNPGSISSRSGWSGPYTTTALTTPGSGMTADGAGTGNGGTLQAGPTVSGNNFALFDNQVTPGAGFGNRWVLDWYWIHKASTIPAYSADAVARTGDNTRMLFIDANNWLNVSVATNFTPGRITLTGRVNGSDVVAVAFNSTEIAPGAEGKITIEFNDGFIRGAWNDVWFDARSGAGVTYPMDIITATAIPSDKRTGKGLIQAEINRRTPIAKQLAVRKLGIWITETPAFFGRADKFQTTAPVTISGGFPTGEQPSAFYYQLLDNSGAPVSGAQGTLQQITPTIVGDTWSINFDAPLAGGLTCRVVANRGSEGFEARSRKFSTGAAMVIAFGQSNAVGLGEGLYTGASTLATAANMIAADATSGRPVGQINTAFRPGNIGAYRKASNFEYARLAAEDLGIPVCAIYAAVPGQAMSSFETTDANWINMVMPSVAAVGGHVEAVHVDQGEAEAAGAYGAPEFGDASNGNVSWSTFLVNTIAAQWRALVGNPQLEFTVSDIGRYAGTTGGYDGSAPGSDIPAGAPAGYTRAEAYNAMRAQQRNTGVLDTKFYPGPSRIGLAHVDGYHYTDAANTKMAERIWYHQRYWVYGAGSTNPLPASSSTPYLVRRTTTHGAFGSYLTGTANRSGATITLPVTLNGATGLTGAAVTGFLVSTDGGTTYAAPSAAAVSGSNIVLTLASDPGAPVRVRYAYGWSIDDTALPQCTYSDMPDVPLRPLLGHIVSN